MVRNPFNTWGDDLWTKLDALDDSELLDSPDEARAFEQRVDEEIKARLETEGNGADRTLGTADVLVAATAAGVSAVHDHPPPSLSTPGGGSAAPSPIPASVSSLTRNKAITPSRPTFFDAPSVATPSLPPPLRAPPKPTTFDSPASVPTTTTFDTPANVPTPTQTPDPGSVGRGRRDDPATPVPLGGDSFTRLRGKRDFLNLTKHFENFSKAVGDGGVTGSGAASGSGSRGRGGRARGGAARAPSTLGLGGVIFKGLRFCIPPETNQVARHKQRWDIIAKLGGTVVIQPDTAITHVIYDPGRSASAALLARELGLQALSELPAGTVCVKWDWVVKCKLAGKVLETTAWLSFPPTSLSRAVSTGMASRTRMVDITQQLRSSSAIRRKRDHTPSDSETESSLAPSQPARPPLRRGVVSDPTHSSPARSVSSRNPRFPLNPKPNKLIRAEVDRISTRHDAPSGPGWVEADSEQDGLDVMIIGLKNGSVEDNGSDSGGSDSEEEAGSPNPMADRFKCGQNHDGKGEGGPNEWLARKFDDLHDLYEGVQGKNDFAIRGYQRAAGIMRRTTYPITSGAQARKIKGIGEGLADRIDEFIKGGIGRAYYEDTESARTIAVFKDIYGVGKNFANALYHRGARSIEDLKTKDFGLTAGQKIGVELYDDLCSRIPREECRELFENIRSAAIAIDPKLWIEIMGSYRRGASSSGDIDILITRDTADGITHAGILRRLVMSLHQLGIITHDLSTPTEWNALEAKWMGVGRISATHKYRRIDILCIPYDQWGAALLYFTGNEVFNRSLRLYARKKGYSLNQRGLSRGVIRDRKGNKMTEGVVIASRTEEEIFDVLGIRWRAPHHRCP